MYLFAPTLPPVCPRLQIPLKPAWLLDCLLLPPLPPLICCFLTVEIAPRAQKTAHRGGWLGLDLLGYALRKMGTTAAPRSRASM